MESKPISKYTVSFGLSLALCSVVNALLVVAKESSPAVAAHMQKLTGHHWITHSAFVIGLFFLCGWLFSLGKGGQGPRFSGGSLIGIVVGGVLAGGLIITGFYLIGD